MRIKILLSFYIFFFFTGSVFGQNSSEKLDEWMAINTKNLGGRAILMVLKDGEITYTKSVNEMNVAQKLTSRLIIKRMGGSSENTAFTPQTRVPIASCSKWLSAALVMTFVDEGKLKLSDTLGKFFPILTANGKGNITISDCLAHLTGIKSPPLKASMDDFNTFNTMNDAVENIAKLPTEGKPGTVFRYSNLGLQLAGAVIEQIGGASFQNLFKIRIAAPLGLKNTDFGDGKVALPAGSGISTAEDYLIFLTMILNNGVHKGKRILSENSIKEMQVNRTIGTQIAYAPAEAKDFAYGYGEWLIKNKDQKTASFSSPGLFGSFPMVNPTEKYAAVLITLYLNNAGRNELYKSLKTILDEK